MDTLTHALSGALLARITAPRATRPDLPSVGARMLAGFFAAAFPDIDFALRLIDTLTYLNAHQGITHSIVLLPVWGFIVAWILAHLMPRYPWQAFYGVALLGLGVHIAEDVITAYGTQLLAPLSDWRYAIPLSFVIDPYFTGILIMGFAALFIWPKRRLASILSLLSLIAYIGLQAVLRERALEFGASYANSQGLDSAVSVALPQPLSPFRWKVIVPQGNRYHEALIDLDGPPPVKSPFIPKTWIGKLAAFYEPQATVIWQQHARFGNEHESLVHSAWAAPALAPFRRFAQFSVFDHLEWRGKAICVWFVDLRFTLPGMTPSFRYGACRGDRDDGNWRLARFKGAFFID